MGHNLLHANIRLKNVMVADGLRVHICPKVATAAISSAMHGTGYHHAFPDEAGNEYRWMAVRHPLDRLVSCWAYFCNADTDHEIKGQHDILALGYRHKMPFDDFLGIALDRHNANAHTRKQSIYAGPHKFDRLALMENLGNEWARLQARFDYLKKPISVLHKSNHDHWRNYYRPWQKREAEAAFADDMALYEMAVNSQ